MVGFPTIHKVFIQVLLPDGPFLHSQLVSLVFSMTSVVNRIICTGQFVTVKALYLLLLRLST